MRKKVVVGMSGGVDSSVAAYLLKEQGYDVIGVTMQIWDKDNSENREDSCCGLTAIDDARRVSQMLDIPHYVMNFRNDFKKHVIDYFIKEYQQGRTPNPCIACNRYVKWEALLNKSLQIGADFIATGHYASIIKHNDRYQLKQSKTLKKDQTYALYNLTQQQLKHTLMPLGEYTKDEVRAIAQQIGLLVANKPDSQEICFVDDNNYAKYIEEETGTKSKKGNFVDKDGQILGKHNGVIHYTIGQRKGLGISFGKPVFVTNIDVFNNVITLGDDCDLFTDVIFADNANFMAFDDFEGKLDVLGKIRYSHIPSSCKVEKMGDKLKCTFAEPQRAPTPGQAIVFYQDNLVIGGATIL